MSGDYSRRTFDNKKHYSAVQLQQGRVLLDSDWNEHSDILQYRNQKEIKDIVGRSGVPKKGNGYQISVLPEGGDLVISPGRIYVDGILCELDKGSSPVTYFNQPHYPNPDNSYFPSSPLASPLVSSPASPILSPPATTLYIEDGTYIVYLDVWQRDVNYLEDARIKEVALGDADTSTRLQVVWQVRLIKVTPSSGLEATCTDHFAEWEDILNRSTGKLNARTVQEHKDEDPCILPPSSGYSRLENQLYRIEIHKGGTRNKATFKWSRDNASIQTKITEIDGTTITVTNLGKDEVSGFAADQWVEIIDDEVALNCASKSLFQIETVKPETNSIILKNSADSFKNKELLRLCRWDHSGTTASAEGIAMTSDWLKIEDSIEIQFSDGNYLDGDFWLIPARTATREIEWPPYNIPNVNPEEQSPLGIKHHLSKLAILKAINGLAKLTDCRKLFPSLANLQAEDIAYDNSNCNINNADNVQEAIDMLCAVRDLREHNKFLHGYGVVCGLKVICGAERTDVIVEKGYALDCEGDIIQVKKVNEIPFKIVNEASKLLDSDGNGKVSLYITGCSENGPDLRIEQFVKQDFWDEVLEGTLLKDFYEGCVKNLFDFLKQNFPMNFSDTPPVPVSQRRLTALINLLAQIINSSSGPYAFISGIYSKKRDELVCKDENILGRYEDYLLWCLYNELKTLLNSQTYCAMFEGDRLFPNYGIDPGLETIFGPTIRLHHKLKLHSTGKYSYTCGFDNKIFVYDLNNKELMQTLVFPASSNIKIQDLVINSKGTELYSIGLLDDKDTIFAYADIDSNGKVTWAANSVKCGSKYKSLALSQAGNLYAIQIAVGLFEVKDIGLPTFSLTLLTTTKTPIPKKFNATGMLVLSDDGTQAFFAECQTSSVESASFTHITRFYLTQNPITSVSYQFQGNDFGNDITLVGKVLYITGDSQKYPGKRVLGKYDLSSSISAYSEVEIENSWIIRMTPVSSSKIKEKYMLLSLADTYKIVRVNLKTLTLDTEFRIPTQIFPMDIVAGSDKIKKPVAYVVNAVVNTLTEININAAFNTANPPNFTHEPPVVIATYRDGVIDAYSDLLGHFLQYLKDCFSDKFLVDCPKCDKDSKVYLATIEIRKKQVYNINNFSKRSYVKTPELWEYWLSTIPILPALKEKFKEFCGSIL